MVLFFFQQFSMPGDPTILEGVLVGTALTTTDLLNAVAVKLPLFWLEDIETWFVQYESQFGLKGVQSSQTKFDYCVQSMAQEVAVEVLDLIRNPPANKPQGHATPHVCSQ